MQRLRDAIENMLREAVKNGSTVVPGWRGEIVTIAEEMIEAEREACATICEPTWSRPGGNYEAIREWDVRKDLAAIIRMRSNGEVRGASRLAGEASASTVVLAGTTGRKD